VPETPPLIRRVQDPRFAVRAGNAAGVASFLALAALGRPTLGRILPALLVRRHVRRALQQFSSGGRRKRLQLVASSGAIAALAVGASRRRRPEA
jgi:hypothetical protein